MLKSLSQLLNFNLKIGGVLFASNFQFDMPPSPAAAHEQAETQVADLPEVCLAQVLSLTSPRDAARCAAVSPAFRAVADSDDVWRTFLPSIPDLDRLLLRPTPPPPAPPAVVSTKTTACSNDDTRKKKKDAYLSLCDAGALVGDGTGEGCVRVWLEKATGARCYALSARRLSLPWDDGEFTWRWTAPPHPLSTRFPDVAELLADCTCLDVYGRLPAAALTPGTPYAAYLVYGTSPEREGGHRGLSFPDQETTVAVGGRVVARHAVCLRPDAAEARKFRAIAAGAGAGGAEAAAPQPPASPPRQPRLREDGWWEMEMGRLRTPPPATSRTDGEVVQASFEVLGCHPKRGLVVESIEFRPLR